MKYYSHTHIHTGSHFGADTVYLWFHAHITCVEVVGGPSRLHKCLPGMSMLHHWIPSKREWANICSCQQFIRVGLGLCCLMTPGLSKDIRCHVVSRGVMRSAASSYAAMHMVAGSCPVFAIAWAWHIGLALLCGCSGALEYPTTNSCGPINKSLSLSLCMTIPFLKLQITRSDTRPHIKWAVSLVIAYGQFNFPRGLCGYIWDNIKWVNSLGQDQVQSDWKLKVTTGLTDRIWGAIHYTVQEDFSIHLYMKNPPEVLSEMYRRFLWMIEYATCYYVRLWLTKWVQTEFAECPTATSADSEMKHLLYEKKQWSVLGQCTSQISNAHLNYHSDKHIKSHEQWFKVLLIKVRAKTPSCLRFC